MLTSKSGIGFPLSPLARLERALQAVQERLAVMNLSSTSVSIEHPSHSIIGIGEPKRTLPI